jgi:pSer/pThr/pTyr-binding forkhead associated (FHA) protein
VAWALRLTEIESGPALAAESAPAPHLYLVLEGDQPLSGSARHCLAGVREVTIGRGSRRTARRDGARLALVVPDRWLSSQHARLVRGGDGWEVHDAGSKNGTFVNGAQTRKAVLDDGDLIEVGHSFWLWRAAAPIAAGAPLDVHAGRALVDGVGDQLATEDLGLLIGELLRTIAGGRARALPCAAGAPRSLLMHRWQRGVGELRSLLDAAVALAGDGNEIEREHLPIARPPTQPPPLQDAPSERDRIADALRAAGGNQTRAARKLGMSRTTLARRMKELEVAHAPGKKKTKK